MAIASLLLGSGNAWADDARIHKLTFSLNVSSQGEPEGVEKENGNSTFSQKILTGKFGNKQFLELMKEEGVIDDIKGWSVVLVTNDSGELVEPFLTKKGETPLDISEYLSFGTDSVLFSEKGSFNAAKELEKGSTTEEGFGSVVLTASALEAELVGLSEIKTSYVDDNEGRFDYIDGLRIVGFGEAADADGNTIVVKGSISAAEGSKGSLEDFPVAE